MEKTKRGRGRPRKQVKPAKPTTVPAEAGEDGFKVLTREEAMAFAGSARPTATLDLPQLDPEEQATIANQEGQLTRAEQVLADVILTLGQVEMLDAQIARGAIERIPRRIVLKARALHRFITLGEEMP